MGRFFKQPLWTKAQTLSLVQKLKMYPILYDKNHPLHLNKNERHKAIRSLCIRVKHMKPSCTPKLLGKKVNHLKFEYNKEQQKLTNPPPDTINPGVPTLWCYNELKALYEGDTNPTEDPNESSEYIEVLEEVEGEFPETNEPFDTTDEISVEHVDVHRMQKTENRTKPKSKFHTNCSKLVESLSNEIKSSKEDKTNTETDTNRQNKPQTFLGLMVEAELSAVSYEIFQEAKWKIMRILEEASKRELELKVSAQRNSQLT